MLNAYWTVEAGEPVLRHYECEGEVWWLEDGEICTKCGEQYDFEQ